MLRKLLPYMKKYRKNAILSPVMMILEVLVDVLIPSLMALMVDVGIKNHDMNYVLRMGLFMVLAAIFGMLMGTLSSFQGAKAGFGFATEVRQAAFRKIQNYSFANLDALPPSTLITRLTQDSDILGQVAMMSLRMAIRAPFMMVLALIMAINKNPGLSFVFAVAIPVMILVLFLLLRWAGPKFLFIQEKVDALNARVQDNLNGIFVVKAFNRQDHEAGLFAKRNDDLRDTVLRLFSILMLLMPMLNLLIYGCITAVLWVGGQQIMAGTTQAGDLIAFITYITQIMMSLMMISMYFMMVTRGVASGNRLLEVIQTESEIHTPQNALMEVPNGDVSFEGVHFRYPGNGHDVLENINLSVKEGQVVGIIGGTGSGKTSLVQLIPRLYDATQGVVRVGGHDVKEYDLQVLRQTIGMVLQKNTLVSGSLRANMQWGNENATDEEIIQALKYAQAWDFVSEYEDGLDHRVEQGGGNFSGGQKQRLTIARALVKKPRIMILDDSTSAVDTDTDARIRRTFKEHLKDTTTFIIAQRISSISDADLILVLDGGTISASGSHEELLQSSQIYREIVESQEGGLSE